MSFFVFPIVVCHYKEVNRCELQSGLKFSSRLKINSAMSIDKKPLWQFEMSL